jgi:integrase
MSTSKATPGPHKRIKTRHRGITYRLRADGSRTYYVYAGGRFLAVDGGEKEALAKQAELRAKLARGERLAPRTVKFREVAEQWVASKRHLRSWTRKSYRRSLDRVLFPRFGHLKLAQITPDRIAELIRDLEAEGLAAATIDNYLKPLNGTFVYAIRHGLAGHNPVAALTPDDRPRGPRRREHRIWSPADIQALLEGCERLARQPKSKYDYTPLIRTAVYTGLRIGELLGLRWGDIDLQEGVIHVQRQWTREGVVAEPKTPTANRRVPLAPEMVKQLAALKLRSPFSADDDFVFASKTGETPVCPVNVRRRGFHEAVKLAGLDRPVEPKLTFHDLRHAFASIMIERGVSSTVLAAIMGHTNSSITETIYIHLFNRQRADDQVRQAMQEAMNL